MHDAGKELPAERGDVAAPALRDPALRLGGEYKAAPPPQQPLSSLSMGHAARGEVGRPASKPIFPIYGGGDDVQAALSDGGMANSAAVPSVSKAAVIVRSGSGQTLPRSSGSAQASLSVGQRGFLSYSSRDENKPASVKELLAMSKHLEEAKRKIQDLDERGKMWQDRSLSLEETLKGKDVHIDEKAAENKKLLYIIGMQEGELARLHREIDHLKEVRHLDGRQMYETRPGEQPRPSSPYFNEIDLNAKVVINARRLACRPDADICLPRRVCEESLKQRMMTWRTGYSSATRCFPSCQP